MNSFHQTFQLTLLQAFVPPEMPAHTPNFRSVGSEADEWEVAGRARPEDHFRSPSICSAINRDNGTDSRIA